MVTVDVASSASGVNQAIEDLDAVSLAALAGLGASGVFIGQEIADQVLPMIIGTPDPTTPSQLSASVAVKLAAAIVMGIAARRFGGGKGALGVITFGTLVSLGLDMIDILQRGSLPGMAPSTGSKTQVQSRSPPRAPKVQSRPKSPSASSSGTSGAAAGGYR